MKNAFEIVTKSIFQFAVIDGGLTQKNKGALHSESPPYLFSASTFES